MFITWVSSFFFWKNQLLILLFCFLLIHPTLGRFLLIFIFVTLQIYQSFWCKLNLFYVHILLFKSNLYLKSKVLLYCSKWPHLGQAEIKILSRSPTWVAGPKYLDHFWLLFQMHFQKSCIGSGRTRTWTSIAACDAGFASGNLTQLHHSVDLSSFYEKVKKQIEVFHPLVHSPNWLL